LSTAELKIALGPARPTASSTWPYRAVLSTPFLGIALAATTWPLNQIAPGGGPDFSWMAALFMAHSEGLRFGQDLFFTYGPLGFLEVPVLYDPGLWMLAFAYQLLVHVGLAISLLWVGRRNLPLPAALAVVYLALVCSPLSAAAVLLAFLWSFVVVVDERCPPRLRRYALRGVALLSAVELLGKQNYGLTALALVLGAALCVPERRRRVPEVLAITGLGYLLLWVASGQSISLLPEFVLRQKEIVSGYSSAMPTDILAHSWEIPGAIAAIALLLLSVAWGAWRTGSVARAGGLALAALLCFASFKQGFVRHSSGNTPEFFAILVGAGIVATSGLPRTAPRWTAALLVVPLIAVLVAAVPGASISRTLDPGPHTDAFGHDLRALVSPAQRNRIVAQSRKWMTQGYGLDRGFRRAIGDRTIQIEPWEASAAWAYGLNWKPLPTLQGYAAYTPALDELNASALRSDQGPELVLRHRALEPGQAGVDTVDNRFPGWSSPAAMRELLCKYRAVRTNDRWQLLERAGDRCGPELPLAVLETETGVPIDVPAPPSPNEMVFARVSGLGVDGLEALRTLAFRAQERTASLDGGRDWRVVPATAGDGLILRVSPRLDFPAPFRLAPGSRTVEFGIRGSDARPLTVAFFAQRIAARRR
jgi:hypothetical protein